MTSFEAPRSLRGDGRVYWSVDRAPADGGWPSWLPHYTGFATINGVRFKVEGWRTENDAGRHVRLTFLSQPLPAGQWPQR